MPSSPLVLMKKPTLSSLLPPRVAPVVIGKTPPGEWTSYPSLDLYGYACIGDGNCFWRAAAVQLYGSQAAYPHVRRTLQTYVHRHPTLTIGEVPLAVLLEASGFGTLDAWETATTTDRTFGGYLEAALLAECYTVRVELYTGSPPSLADGHVFRPNEPTCLRFYFHDHHYDALFVDYTGDTELPPDTDDDSYSDLC
jgi:hypothetical protein